MSLETVRSTPLTSAPDAALMFPTLTSAQIARIASHGVTRAVTRGEVLISEVLMRALIHRRIAVVAQGIGDALLIGSGRSAATLRIKEFLTRNGHPFKYLDLDRDADVQDLLDRFHVDRAEVPVLICRGAAVLKQPSNQEIADRLGFNERIDKNHGGGGAGATVDVLCTPAGGVGRLGTGTVDHRQSP